MYVASRAAQPTCRADRGTTASWIWRQAIAGGLALTATVASVAAQSPFATISGTVHDQLGGTVPRVTLTLTNAESGAKHEIKSTGIGTFQFIGVPAGNYTLAVSNEGFKTLELPMQVAAGQTMRRDMRLEVGTLQETITVAESHAPEAPARPRRAPRPPTSCTAEPNSGGIKPPVKVADTRPRYPASMVGSSEVGHVSLQAVIGTDGAVRTVDTVDATSTDFADAAKEAVGQWRFTSTLLNCVPVEVEMNVAVLFRPDGGNQVDVTRGTVPPPLPPPPHAAPQR